MTKKTDPFFIDKWCAKRVRKVSFCMECLHYNECKSLGHSCSLVAQNHNDVHVPENPWDRRVDDD